MTVSPTGSVSDVQGVADMVKQMSQDLADVPEPYRTQLTVSMEQQYTDETVGEMMQGLLSVYPDHPVAVGESWEEKTPVYPGMTATNVWTFKESKDDVNTLELNGTLNFDPSTFPTEAGSPPSIEGKVEGTLELSAKTGWILGGSLTRKATIEQSVPLPATQEMSTATTTIDNAATLGPLDTNPPEATP
jgi:hypothetical protein